jgi:phosphatidylglycerol---prolipoprotein diacylglyceryl transferase
MYPTLYHACHDVLGLDLQVLKLINTFGFLVALAFFAGARCLSAELARKHRAGQMVSTWGQLKEQRPTSLGDVLLSGLAVFAVTFKFFGVALGKYALVGGVDAQHYLLSLKGHLWAGLACSWAWTGMRLRAGGAEDPADPKPQLIELLPQNHTAGITMAAAAGGLLGAKLFSFLERPRSIIAFLERPSIDALFSGLTIYGGLIVGGLFVLVYSRRNKLSFAHIADASAPGLMLAYGVGRIGCHLAGDGDWGIPNTHAVPAFLGWLPSWTWSFDYPNNVIGSGVAMLDGGYAGYGMHLLPPVWPTPLYEAATAGLLFLVLWNVRRRIAQPWMLFSIYLMLNGFERFWIEKIRVNATYDLWGWSVTQAELIALLMFLGGASLCRYAQLRRRAIFGPTLPPKGASRASPQASGAP